MNDPEYFFQISGPSKEPDLDMYVLTNGGKNKALVGYVSTRGSLAHGPHRCLELSALMLHHGVVSLNRIMELPGDTSYADATQTLYMHVLLNQQDVSGRPVSPFISFSGERLTITHDL